MTDEVVVGKLVVAFVIAAEMEDAEITPDSPIANGMRSALAALRPGDDLGDGARVVDNKHWLAHRNKSGCVCQLKDDGSDEVLAVCGAHEEWGENVARQAAEAMRERIANHIRERLPLKITITKDMLLNEIYTPPLEEPE